MLLSFALDSRPRQPPQESESGQSSHVMATLGENQLIVYQIILQNVHYFGALALKKLCELFVRSHRQFSESLDDRDLHRARSEMKEKKNNPKESSKGANISSERSSNAGK